MGPEENYLSLITRHLWLCLAIMLIIVINIRKRDSLEENNRLLF